MRRFARVVLLVLLALTLVPAAASWPGGFGPKAAHACSGGNSGMHQVGYASAGNTDPLGNNASTDITAYQNDCGDEQERYSVWSRTGSSLSNVSITMRLWQCNFNFETVHIFSSVAWTGWYSSGGCGNRADDVGSSGTTACTQFACYNSNNGGVFYDTIWQ